MDITQPLDLDLFRSRLTETIAWCSKRASATDPKSSLRTPGLLPQNVVERGGLSECRAASVFAEVVEAVTVERSKRLREPLHRPRAPANDMAGGSVLLVMPDWSLDYCISEYVSDGFFDADDFPPWDTWVWYGDEAADEEHYLLCWVPPALLECANRGAEVSPEPWIFWAAQYRQYMRRHSPMLRRLETAGWLAAPLKPPGE
jgi:hypothetical protein